MFVGHSLELMNYSNFPV